MEEKAMGTTLDEAREAYAKKIVEAYEASGKEKSIESFLADELNAVAAIVGASPKNVVPNSCNSGTPTSKNPLGQPSPNKRHSRNSRSKDMNVDESGKEGDERKRSVKPPFSEEEIDETETIEAESCAKCGSGSIVPIGEETRYEHRLVITTKKVKIVYMKYRCNDCGAVFTEQMKQGQKFAGPDRAVYNEEVEKVVLELRDLGNVPINKVCDIIGSMTQDEMKISEGYVVKVLDRASRKLVTFYNDLMKLAVQYRIVFWDDTHVNSDGTSVCMRAYCNEHFTIYVAHEHKDTLSLLEDAILTSLTQEHTVMHDHVKLNYNPAFLFNNIECLAHFQRALLLVNEKTEHEWARLLLLAVSLANSFRKELLENGVHEFPSHYYESLWLNIGEIVEKGRGDHGKMKETDYGYVEEERLLNMINDYWPNLFLWTADFSIPTTNNLSEQAARKIKRWMAVSGTVKGIDNAMLKALRATYIETCKKNGVSESDALARLAAGNPYTVAELFHLGEDLVLPDGTGIPLEKIEEARESSKEAWEPQLYRLWKNRKANEEKKQQRKEGKKSTILEKHKKRQEKYSGQG